MNRWKHRIPGGILAVLLAAVFALPAYPKAGDEVVKIDFDDGTVCGFETYTEGGACSLENDNGALAVKITSCGHLDYANQAYWDGFSLEQNCQYRYSFDISCSIDRQVEYRLQLNGGDYHAYLGERIRVGQEPSHISVDWTMTEESDPAPRLCFNMGFEEDMAQDPGAHTVWIDHISLTVLDDSGVSEDAGDAAGESSQDGRDAMSLSVNQAGYRPEDVKTAFLRLGDEEALGPDAVLCVEAEDGSSVMELKAEPAFYDAPSGAFLCRADFSALTQLGTYRIRAGAQGEEVYSQPFEIGEDRYEDLLRSTFQMLYLQRCGVKTSPPAGSQAEAFAHGACHNTPAVIYGTDQTKDVSGGWHDAGDYGRYVVSGAKAAADLFLACEQYGLVSDDLGIAQSGNGIPDVLDEARWELDWMLKMQDGQSGGVWHKVTCRSFPGEVRPEEETDELVISPVSLAATLDFAAVMAKAGILYEPYDADFARRAAEAAHSAWKYAKSHKGEAGFHNPPEISTGEYPDENVQDELLWAAAELYLAAMPGVEASAEDGSEKTQAGMGQSGPDLPDEQEIMDLLSACQEHGLGWQCVADYALLDLALSDRSAGVPSETAKERLTQYGQQLLEQADGYGLTLGEDYPWGSNMTVADHGNLLLLVCALTGEDAYAGCAKQHLDYLLGANPTGYCYVTGCGTLSPEHPHHRPSQAAGRAMKGMLVGGPNSHLEDPYAQNVLADVAPALCYADNAQSYSTNEVAVYWNAPLIALLAGCL